MKLKRFFSLFRLTRSECLILCVSVLGIAASFFAFGGGAIRTLIASLIGVTSLVYNAKGNPVGQALMILFSIFYGAISLSFAYYGEVLTYLGMTAPMAIFSLITWIRNPFEGNRGEVKIAKITAKEAVLAGILTLIVTLGFGAVLKAWNTTNLIPSTISVATSFAAAYLTFRRSSYFTLAYAANDIVLILLWILAARSDTEYYSVVACFAFFFVNDLYGFLRWKRREKEQRKSASVPHKTV